MYARVTTASTPHVQQEHALRVFRESTVPIVLSRPGLIQLIVLTSRAASRTLTISLWATEHARHATSSDPMVLNNLASFGDLVSGAFNRAAYDVIADTWQPDPALDDPDASYARVTTTQFRLDAWRESVALLREIAARPAGEPAGYAGSLVLADPATGNVFVAEAWRTRSALAAYDATVYQHDRVARERNLLASLPQHDVYRVMLVAAPRTSSDTP
jgi:quinol monooxygenase YgiN